MIRKTKISNLKISKFTQSNKNEKTMENKLEDIKKSFFEEKYTKIAINNKKELDELYKTFRTNQNEEMEKEKRDREEEKRRIIEEERLKREKEFNYLQRKKKVMKKMKAVFLTIQLFKRAARDYKVEVKMQREAFDYNFKDLYQEMVFVHVSEFNENFADLFKEYFGSKNLKSFLITSDKFILNEYDLTKINNEQMEKNSNFVIVF